MAARGYAYQIVRVELVSAREEGGQQLVDARGLAGEQFKRLLRIEPHGFASVPLAGAQGIGVSFGGRRDQTVLLGIEGARPAGLGAGDVALYHPDGRILKYADGATSWALGDTPLMLTTSGTVTVEAAVVRLGPGPYHRVVTEAGLSNVVFATI